MKYLRILAFILTLCFCLSGCSSSKSTTTSDTSLPPITEGTRGEPDMGIDIDFELLGCRTVNHSLNISQVKYITSASDLPDYDELSKYTDSWFADHALLMIFESVATGKTTVGIEKIQLDGTTANITLSHPMDGTLSIATGVTWLLWAEIEPGLNYTWHITNPALESDISDR